MSISQSAPSEQLKIVIVGHVDHGKSTLVGRLLHETGSLPDGKLEMLQAVSARRGMPFEWSFLLDALQTERDQGITIDTTQIRFRTRSRDVVLIDAPGHAEFLRNMITGASQADAAVLIIDAAEGVREYGARSGPPREDDFMEMRRRLGAEAFGTFWVSPRKYPSFALAFGSRFDKSDARFFGSLVAASMPALVGLLALLMA